MASELVTVLENAQNPGKSKLDTGLERMKALVQVVKCGGSLFELSLIPLPGLSPRSNPMAP